MARRPRPDAPEQTRPSTGPAHLVALARETIPPVHPDGLPFVAGAAAVALAGRRHRWIAAPAATAAGACAAFFRHPRRVPPTAADVVVAPADGTVSLVDDAVPPPESGLGNAPLPRVSVFLSIFDVHVQRSPITGTVTSVVHTAGRFASADLPEASATNERTTMTLHSEATGTDLAVVQIAGLIARRIVCEAIPGDELRIGETYGLIRFGSRVDVYLPPGTRPQVRVGQRTVGAETLLATLP
ncbi:phosphatidylserine decarboxylase [Gordonia sinesedis]